MPKMCGEMNVLDQYNQLIGNNIRFAEIVRYTYYINCFMVLLFFFVVFYLM